MKPFLAALSLLLIDLLPIDFRIGVQGPRPYQRSYCGQLARNRHIRSGLEMRCARGGGVVWWIGIGSAFCGGVKPFRNHRGPSFASSNLCLD